MCKGAGWQVVSAMRAAPPPLHTARPMLCCPHAPTPPPRPPTLPTWFCVFRGKTNFFERRVGEYQRAGVMQSVSAGRSTEYVFNTTEDF